MRKEIWNELVYVTETVQIPNVVSEGSDAYLLRWELTIIQLGT